MKLPGVGIRVRAETSLDDALDQARRAGADHVALTVSDTPADLLETDVAELARRLARARLACSLVHLGPVQLDNAQTRLHALDRFCRQAQRVAELGCPLVALSAPCSAGHAAAPSLKHAHMDVLTNLMEALAVRSGLRVCVDIAYGGAIETRDDAHYFCNATANPNVGLLLNVGHLTALAEPGWEIVDRHLARVFAVGWQDHHGPSSESPHPVRSVELGTGSSPLVDYWLHLAGREPQPVHVVAVEHVPAPDRPDALRRSIEHLRKVWRLEV